VLIEDALTGDSGDAWQSRRMAWCDFDGERILLHEVTGPAENVSGQSGEDLRRWDAAWDAFWAGQWAEAENAFAALAREREDSAARVFALRSAAARRAGTVS
jgi:hypothetical protein